MRLHRRLIALVLLCLAAACSEAAEPRFSDVSGVYRMEAPETPTAIVLDPRSSVATTITGAILELNPVWHFQINYTREDGSSPGGVGSYRRTDSGVILDYTNGRTEVGTFDGDLLTVDTGYGPILRFQKVGS